jgi:hypothetical protein
MILRPNSRSCRTASIRSGIAGGLAGQSAVVGLNGFAVGGGFVEAAGWCISTGARTELLRAMPSPTGQDLVRLVFQVIEPVELRYRGGVR